MEKKKKKRYDFSYENQNQGKDNRKYLKDNRITIWQEKQDLVEMETEYETWLCESYDEG